MFFLDKEMTYIFFVWVLVIGEELVGSSSTLFFWFQLLSFFGVMGSVAAVLPLEVVSLGGVGTG